MMFRLMMTAALLLTAANAFAYTHCSDSEGANRYLDDNYRGGPEPEATTVIDDVRIYENSALASETTTLSDGTVNAGPLVANFDQASMNPIGPPSDPFIKDYTISVSFAVSNQSQFPGGGPPPPKFLMLCHQDNTPVP